MIRDMNAQSFFNKTVSSLSIVIYLFCFSTQSLAQTAFNLPRSTPEKEQVSSAAIAAFYEAAAKTNNEFHSFMLLRHGKVISEGWWAPYAPTLRHTMYSVSKSFTATAIGFAVTEKKITLQDKVVDFFKEQLPDTVSSMLAALTIKDLITMSAGQSPDPTGAILRGDTDWVKHFFEIPVVDTPGTKFLYNSAATFMLSAIIQKVTGEKLIDYLNPRLFHPLGIYNIDWEENPQGINSGGWGLRLKTEDMARFGQFFLQKGQWQGKQLLPASWIEEASSFKIKNAHDTALTQKAKSDWAQGYCYQMWRCRNNAYRGDGAFGQYIIVMPDQDAVIAITSETADMQSILNLVWEYLLPALKDNNVPVNTKAAQALKQAALNLKIPLPVYKDSKLAAKVSGKTYTLAANDASISKLSFLFKANQPGRLIIQYQTVSDTVILGKNSWAAATSYRTTGMPSLTGTTAPVGPAGLRTKIAAAYTWTSDQSLEIKLRYLESPHAETYRFSFDKNNIQLRIDNSLKAMAPGGNDKNPVFTGTY